MKKTIEQKLSDIANKYKNIGYNQENYAVGGGLASSEIRDNDGNCAYCGHENGGHYVGCAAPRGGGKFASKRHEDAKYDAGKLTEGEAGQIFKKATELDLDRVKAIINYAVPNMEWHHAGKLPKAYGGGMKKTYFLNSNEIADLAENWHSYNNRYDIHIEDQRRQNEAEKSLEKRKEDFLIAFASKVVRISEKPAFFHEIDREMNGKHGWFSSYGKYYNLPEYYTGWAFASEDKYNEFLNLK